MNRRYLPILLACGVAACADQTLPNGPLATSAGLSTPTITTTALRF